MDQAQRDKFYKATGFQEPESYIESLRDQGKSTLTINNSEYLLFESGFASYCMQELEFDAIKDGILIQL